MGKPGKPFRRKPSPESSCWGKQKFSTYLKALAASRLPSKKMYGKHSPKRGKLEPYKCHYCDGYHFGHPIRRKR